VQLHAMSLNEMLSYWK